MVAKKAVGWAGAVLLTGLLFWAAAHLFITPVNPDQQAPTGHAQAECWTCHLVMSSADVVVVD